METSKPLEQQQQRRKRWSSPQLPSFHACASLTSKSAGGRCPTLSRSRTTTAAGGAVSAASAEACPDTQAHRDVCLKRLARLAHQLGLPTPCRLAEARRTACRSLLGKRQEAHLGWCRHLLDAYQQLRLDRDDLAERCATHAISAAKLEARLTQRDRQLAEAQQQLGRLHTAAAAASQTLRGRQHPQHRQHDQHLEQHQEQQTKRTRAPTQSQQMEPPLSPQLHRCWGSRQPLDSSTGDDGGCVGGSSCYKPPDTRATGGISHIPLPVWWQHQHQHQHQYQQQKTGCEPMSLQFSPAAVSDATGGASLDGSSSSGGGGCGGGGNSVSSACPGQLHQIPQRHRQQRGSLQAQPPSRPLHHHLQQQQQRQSRRAVAASVSCHSGGGPSQVTSSSSRHKRSRTYDKPASEMLDRWQRPPVISAPVVSTDGDH